MKFSAKMCLKIILKFTKNQGFTLSVEDTFFEKGQRWGGRGMHSFLWKLFLLVEALYGVRHSAY